MAWDQKPSRWQGVNRGLPAGWAKIREQVFKRDGYRCMQALPSGKRCPRGRATSHRLECDHVGDPNDHRLESLQTLCEHHHAQKTAKQGVERREARRSQRRQRPVEKRPGEL